MPIGISKKDNATIRAIKLLLVHIKPLIVAKANVNKPDGNEKLLFLMAKAWGKTKLVMYSRTELS